jgi:anti-sigma factor RsiW
MADYAIQVSNMDTVIPQDPIHRELELLLPWYVNGRLEAEEARQVEAHLAACPACQKEASQLAKLLAHEAASIDDRPVGDAKVHALFARIDRLEEQQHKRGRAQRTDDGAERASLREAFNRMIQGLMGTPGLVAATVAAVALAFLVTPMFRYGETTDARYDVLSSNEPTGEELRVRLRFSGAASPEAVERLVSSSVKERQVKGTYRVEQRQGGRSGEYIVTFDEKPSVDTVSRLLDEWRAAPNVANVSIDGSTVIVGE